MAQANEFGEVLQFALFAGVAWVAWNLYESYQLGAAAAAAAPAASSTPPASTPAAVPAIVIPAGFSVASDINNSYKGSVTYNGSSATFNVILPAAGATPATSGVVFNSSGQDVTGLLGPANVQTLVNAYQSAVNTETVAGTLSGFSGLGQVAVPPIVFTHRVLRVPPIMPVRRRREFV